jgi:hypothetical protein
MQKNKLGLLFKKLLPVKGSSTTDYNFSEIDLRLLGKTTVDESNYNQIIEHIHRNAVVTSVPTICLIGPSGCGKVYFFHYLKFISL